MTLVMAVIVDTSLILAAGLLTAMLLRRRSAALRHWVLLATMSGAALAPALELILPPWRLALATPSIASVTTPASISSEPAAATSTAERFAVPARSFDRSQLLLLLWGAGAFVGVVVLCVGLWRLSRLASRAHPVTAGSLRRSIDAVAATVRQRRVRLLTQETHPGLVVTWGMRRPTILLPASAINWPESRQRAVLLHELAHVERGDWAMRIFALALRCAYWFNPLMWMVDRRVQHESERACDDEVMRAGVSGTDYAGHLLAVAREAIGLRSSWSPATAVAQPSTLEERIQAMLTTGLDRKPLGRFARIAALAALIAGVIPLAAASPTSRSTSADPIADSTAAESSVAPASAIIRPWSEARGMGQGATAAIVGVLYDQHSGLLPGVEVALTQDASGATQSVTSDGNGGFAFRDLPPGDYTLVTSLAGFQRVRNMIRLSAGAQLQRNILLPLGTVQETVTVSNDGSPSATKPGVRPERDLPEPRIASPCVGRVGGCVKPPRKVFHVSPDYPAALAAAGITGQVVLSGRVGLDGYMSDLQAVDPNAQVHPDLVAAAIEGVRQWEFNPTYLNGAPVEAAIRITVNFVNSR
jgi:TonB family protein